MCNEEEGAEVEGEATIDAEMTGGNLELAHPTSEYMAITMEAAASAITTAIREVLVDGVVVAVAEENLITHMEGALDGMAMQTDMYRIVIEVYPLGE